MCRSPGMIVYSLQRTARRSAPATFVGSVHDCGKPKSIRTRNTIAVDLDYGLDHGCNDPVRNDRICRRLWTQYVLLVWRRQDSFASFLADFKSPTHLDRVGDTNSNWCDTNRTHLAGSSNRAASTSPRSRSREPCGNSGVTEEIEFEPFF